MSVINKNSTSWILVATSMVLLLAFVIYWNASTYFNEKKKLSEDVQIQLQLAFTEVKDTELTLFIKSVIAKDGSNVYSDSISIFLESDSLFPSIVRKIPSREQLHQLWHNLENDTAIILDAGQAPQATFKPNKDGIREITVITAANSKSIPTTDSDSSTINITIDDQEIHDFPRKLTQVLTDSSFTSSDSGFINFNSTGTASTINKTYDLFKEKLIANNLPFEFTIVEDPLLKSDGIRITHSSSNFGFSDWTIDLLDYNTYLLKKMIPTLLFSLFLLSIIGLAFWTLLNNWIKQNRLVTLKNDFINNMTHELKTPLATVGVALEAISNFDLKNEEEKAKEYIDISRNEVSRLGLLVDKVLNIAAFDSQSSTLNPERFDLHQIIQDNIQSFKLQIEEKKAEVHFTSDMNTSTIYADPLHISNIIHNIIDNALKYSSADPKIDIHLEEKGDSIILSVQDNGLGIPKAYQAKIFDRFFRVPTEDRHDVKGHGLGLNYVQNIIHQHGGKITAESAVKKGTTFTISLPKNASNV